ncbi:hypothetical protein MTR_1g092680 [Medicago truncatula]|uniref:Uncharacterized protein n=1 Tax=Medicago truncatula TaxID=3880 RepID=G7I350_MEDTR|nr:hypothetical protein MTR_1g092680 [Medicago truncatula]
MPMWPLTATWHWHMVRKVMSRHRGDQVELFFGQELGNISSYAPSGFPRNTPTISSNTLRP